MPFAPTNFLACVHNVTVIEVNLHKIQELDGSFLYLYADKEIRFKDLLELLVTLTTERREQNAAYNNDL